MGAQDPKVDVTVTPPADPQPDPKSDADRTQLFELTEQLTQLRSDLQAGSPEAKEALRIASEARDLAASAVVSSELLAGLQARCDALEAKLAEPPPDPQPKSEIVDLAPKPGDPGYSPPPPAKPERKMTGWFS